MEWAIKAGRLINIDSVVMGFTLLAVGTSLPDCLCSIIMARAGKGEMAISNVFGSNVFDILIALGVPWALQLAIRGSVPQIESDGFLSSACILMFILLLYTTIAILTRCKLPRWSGYLYLGFYAIYIIYV